MMSPYGTAEKQAMLEAPDLKTRAEILIAVTEMDLAKNAPAAIPGCSRHLVTAFGNYSCEQPIARYAQRQRSLACNRPSISQTGPLTGDAAFWRLALRQTRCAQMIRPR